MLREWFKHCPLGLPEIFQPLNRMRRDLLEHIPQIGKGINAVTLTSCDEVIENGGAFASGIASVEDIVFPSKHHSAQCAVVIDTQIPIFQLPR